MDVMELRRGLMAQMAASGANFVNGTFTVPGNASSYTLDFGKSFSKYLYFVEMTDASKTSLIGTGINALKAFGYVGIYPNLSINGGSYTPNSMYARYNPSSNVISGSSLSASSYSESSITFPVAAVDGTSITTLYRNYAYNYFVVEIK